MTASIMQPNNLVIDTGYDLSEPVIQTNGVKQDDSISPHLFVLYVNSLLERLERKKVFVKMLADDLVIAADDDDEICTNSGSSTRDANTIR